MKLTVVGCAPAYTLRPGQSSSCYLVEHEGRALLLDMGQGAFSELARHRAPETVDGVLISHLHADHLVDLIPLRHFVKYESETPGRTSVRGPRELRARVDSFQGQKGFLDALPGDPLKPGTFELAGFTVEARHVTHIEDSFAFRVSVPGDSGPGLVYSGDCAKADDLLPLMRPGDTLLCEAAFGAGPSGGGGHITAQDAARVAAEGRATRLILTHILDRHDGEDARRAAAERYAGDVRVAQPQLVVRVGEG